MAYNSTTPSNLMQTAFQVAGRLVAAEVLSGGTTQQDADARLMQVKDLIFGALSEVQAQEPAPAPQNNNYPSRGRGTGGYQGTANRQPLDPGTLVLDPRYGRHGGKTIAAVYAEDPDFVTWLAEKAANKFINSRAAAFLAAQGAPVGPPQEEAFPFGGQG